MCYCDACSHLYFSFNLEVLKPKWPLTACYYLAPYEGSFKHIFQLLKFEGRSDCGMFLQQKLLQLDVMKQATANTLVLPVPSFWLNYVSRGYNPVEILFEPWLQQKNVLMRKKWGFPSYLLSKNQRIRQLKKAFKVIDPEIIQGKNILLCDDLVASQTTLSEIAKLLMEAGAKRVTGLALFHKT